MLKIAHPGPAPSSSLRSYNPQRLLPPPHAISSPERYTIPFTPHPRPRPPSLTPLTHPTEPSVTHPTPQAHPLTPIPFPNTSSSPIAQGSPRSLPPPTPTTHQVQSAVDAEGLSQRSLRDMQDGDGAARVPGVPDLVAAVGDGLAQRRHLAARERMKGG